MRYSTSPDKAVAIVIQQERELFQIVYLILTDYLKSLDKKEDQL